MKKASPSVIKGIATFTGMVAGTGLAGLIAGGIAALIGASVLRGDLPGFGALAGTLMGMIIGYPIGVFTALFLTNKLFHHPGSLLLGVLGILLGVIITIGLAEPLNLNHNTDLLFISFLLAPPLLGTTGFRLKNRKR